MLVTMLNRISGAANMLASIIEIVRCADFDLPLNKVKAAPNEECVVVGNGPSLKDVLHDSLGFFQNKTLICVNDFAVSEYFGTVKPQFYLMADPAYWADSLSDRHKSVLLNLLDIIRDRVDWPMIVLLPVAAKKCRLFDELVEANKNVKVLHFNSTQISGPRSVQHYFYKKNLAMPRVQNVMIAGIFIALNMGFKTIFLVGADHSWHETIHVTDDNELCFRYVHFYDKEEIELTPIFKDADETQRFKVHELLAALSRMFEGYTLLQPYAESLSAKVLNASRKSYIDAFERYEIEAGDS